MGLLTVGVQRQPELYVLMSAFDHLDDTNSGVAELISPRDLARCFYSQLGFRQFKANSNRSTHLQSTLKPDSHPTLAKVCDLSLNPFFDSVCYGDRYFQRLALITKASVQYKVSSRGKGAHRLFHRNRLFEAEDRILFPEFVLAVRTAQNHQRNRV